MKNDTDKLIDLANQLDTIGLKKYADVVDSIISCAVRGEDFKDLMTLFDEPIVLEDSEEDSPISSRMKSHIPEEHDVLTPITEEDNSERSAKERSSSRIELLKRRQQILKLKKLIEKEEAREAQEDLETLKEEITRTPAEESDLAAEEEEYINRGGENFKEDPSFEDEGEQEENEADDIMLKKKVKEDPGAFDKIIEWIAGHPELLVEALALII